MVWIIGSRPASGESLEVTYTGLDSEPWVQGEWTDGSGGGTLSWQAFMGEDDGYSCSRQQYARCAVHTVDGAEIFAGYVRAKWGGGWDVTYAGASYEVLVTFEPATAEDELPLERAFAFVTDPRWQPTR